MSSLDTQGRARQESRRKRPLSPASVNRELATLRRLLRLAHEWTILDRVLRIRYAASTNASSH
jgi:hypothetical protein